MPTDLRLLLHLLLFGMVRASIDTILQEIEGQNAIANLYTMIGGKEFVRYQLDMLIEKEEFESLMAGKHVKSERNTAVPDKQLWPRIIPYVIEDTFNVSQQLTIVLAMQHIMQHTCIVFKNRAQEQDYIQFISSLRCETQVGMAGNKHDVRLADVCVIKPIVVHEILHALGLYHEHMRSDRDTYLTIHKANIMVGQTHQFHQMNKAGYSDYGHPYDYRSVMHYGKNFYGQEHNTTHKKITMEPTQKELVDVIGNVPGLSFYDIEILNSMYKCTANCKKPKCTSGQFLGKACECYCQGPVDFSAVPCGKPEGCTLPTSNKYMFDDGALNPGEQVKEGSLTKVDCTNDLYDDYYGDLYGDYEKEKHEIFLYCQNGEVVNFNDTTLNCPEVLSGQCDQLNHGTVKDDYGTITVECEQGYSLNIPSYDKEFKCEPDGLVIKRTDTRPKCTPDDCKLPMTIRGMQLEIFPRRLPTRYLSAYQTIVHSTTILVNCTNGGMEPNNRKFKCDAAHWYDVEDEWDVKTHAKNWTEGAFPKCRDAVCSPPCENGGMCIRDNKCRCLTGTEGKLCDRYTCPKQCTDNGGVCNTFNTCTCPNIKYGSYCDLLLSEECEQQLLNGKVEEDAGRISITCDRGYTLTIPPRDTDFKCENNVLLTKRHNRKPTCTPNGCGIPDVDADIPANMVKAIYEVGEEIHGLTCGPGLILVGDSSLRCQQGGTWYGAASCEKIQKTTYRIRVSTGTSTMSYVDLGTNADVFLRLHGQNGVSDEIELRKELDRRRNLFEEGKTGVFQETFNDVGQIREIQIRLSSDSNYFWYPTFITMYDFSRNHYYRFDVGIWMADNEGMAKIPPNKKDRHRQCGDEFSKGIRKSVWYMSENSTARDEIGCKLKCAEKSKCHGAVYHKHSKKCFLLDRGRINRLKEPTGDWQTDEIVYLRTFCKS